MATRIEHVFNLVRDTLNDHQKKRWSDETLLRNLNMAIQDISKQTHIFKNHVFLILRNGIGTYALPDGTLRVSHMTYNKREIPLHSSRWLSHNRSLDWRTEGVVLPEDGALQCGVFDEIKRKEIAVYPKPFGDLITEYESEPTEYGLIGGITDYSQSSYYGVVTEFIDLDIAEEIQTSYFGVATLIVEGEAVTVYYTECPELPTDINGDLPLDEVFDPALKFYVAGMALRNDLDMENRKVAAEEFTLYERELVVLMDLASTDSVSASSFESHYNPMG